jgi:tetratricopeptide (TPR) repeat protein
MVRYRQMTITFAEKILSNLRRRPILCLLLLTCVAGFGWATYKGGQYLRNRYHLSAAQRALEDRDFHAARAHLAISLQIEPDSAPAHFLAARTARCAGDLGAAEEHLFRCQKLNHVMDDTALEWALLQAQSGHLLDVQDYLQQHLREDSADSLLIMEVLSWEYMWALRLAEARFVLDLWLKNRPDDFDALVRRGWVAERLSDTETAQNVYARAVALRPESDSIRLRLAEMILVKDPKEALEHLHYLRQRQPDNPDVALVLARCHRQLGEFEEARQLLDDLLAKPSRNPGALSERGLLALETNDWDRSEKLLREAVGQDPHDLQINYNLYVCLDRRGKKEQAQERLTQINQIKADLKRIGDLVHDVMLKPHDPSLRHEVGMMFLRIGLTEEGLRWLGTALKEDPGYRLTRQALAEHYERAGMKDLAATHRGNQP